MPFSEFNLELERLKQQGLFRVRRVVEGAQGALISVAGRQYLSFCSNDYLGLAGHPDLACAATEAAAEYGVGSGASHLVSGHSVLHHRLEQELAAFVGKPAALLFSSGFAANLGVVTALVGRGDAIFCDKLNHASLNDAALLSRAELGRYPHLDLGVLEAKLAGSKARRKLVATDAVFSMDGDIAPLREILELCERFGAWLLIDDAHGFGVLGQTGAGTLEALGIDSPRVLLMGTLGKAAGVSGAFVAGGDEVVQLLVQRAASYIYTTAQPPLLAAATLASLDLIRNSASRRDHLARLIEYLKRHLGNALLPSDTPIQPLIVGENEACLQLARQLEQDGLLVPAIRPPTVPRGSARLRISLSAAHDFTDLDRLIDALKQRL